MSSPGSVKNTHVLLVECPDAPGLVHQITGALLEQGANVEEQGEFVSRETTRFFIRTAFSGDIDGEALEAALRGALPEDARISLAPQRPRDIVVLVTREAHCLGDLLVRHEFGELNARICAVVGNHAKLGSLVERFGLPFHHVPHQGVSREAHEAAVLAAVKPYAPEYLVLAKYMRILTGDFVSHYPRRIINIHHSFLPAFIGARPYHQAFRRGVKIIGATAHFVTNDLDEGPIIAQDVIHVDHTRDAKSMARAGRNVEKIVLSEALRLVFDDRIFVDGRRTVVFD